MSVYRKAPAVLTVAPPAPWWRLLRAWLTGSLARIPGAHLARDSERRQRARRAANPIRIRRPPRDLDA